jgi:hypothetical protein
MRLKKVCASLHDMAKPSLMNLHILILILLNGHKISCPRMGKFREEIVSLQFSEIFGTGK